MVVGLYQMLKRIRCDGVCAKVVDYLLVTAVDMACDITLPAALCWMRFLPTSPESSATSQSPVEQSSCRPHLRATLLAAQLLNKVLADLTCELHY